MSPTLRHGTDLVHVPRLKDVMERHPRFETEVFTESERTYCRSRPDPWPHFAARFAAKEAALKALKRGLFSGGIDRALLEIEVVRSPDAPSLALRGTVEAAARRANLTATEVSLSHAGEYAIASVLMWGDA
jgi:holo-[acyl-carrier protein] synthase